MTEQNEKAVRARIEGRVQGVWYRAWTCEQAGTLGLDGWVRNRKDGTVEAVFKGPAEKVDRMLVLCRRGPPLAKVRAVSVALENCEIARGFRSETEN
jgi:acylphosphatase